VFGVVLLFLITVMHVYVFWRGASVPLLQRHVPRRFLFAAGALLWLGFFCGRVIGHQGTGAFARALELFGMNWMAILFLLFVALLAMDLLTGFGFLLPGLAPSLRGLALVIGALLSLVALIQGLRPPVVQSYDVSLAGLPREMEGKTVVAMSDLHLGSLLGPEWLAARVNQVRELQPDCVVLLGDLFEGHGRPQGELLPVLRRLAAPLGVWVVPGNHEFHNGNNTALSLVREAGYHLLRNNWVEVRPGFLLAGVDDLTAARRSGRKDDLLAKALADRPAGATILLSHTPWQAEQAARAGVGLMLSGHTHGGQIWPFGYLVKRFYPLLAGRYEVDAMTVIVCRGTGTWGPRMRLWRPGEIVRVRLHRAE